MMVNNSININKMNNHPSLQTIDPQHMALEIQVLAWDRCKNVAGLNQLLGPPVIIGSPTTIQI